MKKRISYLALVLAGSVVLAACGKATGEAYNESIDEEINKAIGEATGMFEDSHASVNPVGMEYENSAVIYDTNDPWLNHYVGSAEEEAVWSFTDSCVDCDWTSIMRSYRNWEESGIILHNLVVDKMYQSVEGDYLCYELSNDSLPTKDYNKPVLLKDLQSKPYNITVGDTVTVYGELDYVMSSTTPIINAYYIDIDEFDEGIVFKRPEVPANVTPCYVGIKWYSYEDERPQLSVRTGVFNVKTVGYLNHGDKVLALLNASDQDPTSESYKFGERRVWQYGRYLGEVDATCLYTEEEWEKANQEGLFDKQKPKTSTGKSEYTEIEESEDIYEQAAELFDDEWEREFIFPYSDTDIISEDALRQIDDYDLRIAKNEIYAMHGRKFKDQTLQDYFNSCSWYTPTTEPEEFDESVLLDVEKENIRRIQEEIDRRGTD